MQGTDPSQSMFVDEVTLEQVFSVGTSVSLVSIIPPVLYTHISSYIILATDGIIK